MYCSTAYSNTPENLININTIHVAETGLTLPPGDLSHFSVYLNRKQLNKRIYTQRSTTLNIIFEERPIKSFTFHSPNFDLLLYSQIKSKTLMVST